jgi:large subunit ribosomal protein L5
MKKENTARLKETFIRSVAPALMEKYKYSNINEVPRLDKIVVNVGLTEAKDNPKVVEIAMEEIAAITGQKPRVCRSKKSISNFKLRQGVPIGAKVTLRGNMMYEFFDRMVNVAFPRVRDFRGFEPGAFDGKGNLNLGLTEQYIFPEVNADKSDKPRGMNITVVTTTNSDEEARELITLLGMPFKKRDVK